MIEPIMYIGIGFLVAGLLVIGVIPLVHARAVRLTMRRLEALTPMSMAEIQADKDQLRAEFAMSMRRLEMTVEQMKAKTTSQARRDRQEERGHRPPQIRARREDRGAVGARGQGKAAGRRPPRPRGELAAKSRRLRRPKQRWRARRPSSPRSPRISRTLDAPTASASSWWPCARRPRLLHEQIESYEKETKELRDRLGSKTAEAAALRQQLAEERGRAAEQLGNRVGELERRSSRRPEAEVLGTASGGDRRSRSRASPPRNASRPPALEARPRKKSEAGLHAELAVPLRPRRRPCREVADRRAQAVQKSAPSCSASA